MPNALTAAQPTAAATGTTSRVIAHWPQILRLCLIEARPAVLVVFGLRYATAAALAVDADDRLQPFRIIMSGLAWLVAVGFAYLYNGIADIDADRLNDSHRPIARGRLAVRDARRVLVALPPLALLLGLPGGPVVELLLLLMLALGYLYSGPWRMERFPSATATILTTAGVITYLAGWLVIEDEDLNANVVVLGVVMALWMGLVGAVAKDFGDLRGDAATGRTVAAGARLDRSRRVRCSVAAVTLGLATLLAGTTFGLSDLQPAGLALTTGGVVVSIFAVATRGAQSRKVLRLPYRAFMVTQYIAQILTICPILWVAIKD